MTELTAVYNAAIEPFASVYGWYGLAWGLLGLRTIRRVLNFARERVGGSSEDE